MNNGKEYVAVCQIPKEVTASEWIIEMPAMKITGETTIAEIDYFFQQHNKTGPTEFKVMELE